MPWVCVLLVLVRAKLSEPHCPECWGPSRSSLCLNCKELHWGVGVHSGLSMVILFIWGRVGVGGCVSGKDLCTQAVQEGALQPSQQRGG